LIKILVNISVTRNCTCLDKWKTEIRRFAMDWILKK